MWLWDSWGGISLHSCSDCHPNFLIFESSIDFNGGVLSSLCLLGFRPLQLFKFVANEVIIKRPRFFTGWKLLCRLSLQVCVGIFFSLNARLIATPTLWCRCWSAILLSCHLWSVNRSFSAIGSIVANNIGWCILCWETILSFITIIVILSHPLPINRGTLILIISQILMVVLKPG